MNTKDFREAIEKVLPDLDEQEYYQKEGKETIKKLRELIDFLRMIENKF